MNTEKITTEFELWMFCTCQYSFKLLADKQFLQ